MEAQFVKTSCGSCGGGIEFTSDEIGKVIACPHCAAEIRLDARKLKYPARTPRPPILPPELPNPIAIEPDAPVRCPDCASTQVTANKKGFGAGGAVSGAIAGGLLFGPWGLLGVLAGLAGSGKVKITCLRCGRQFQPGHELQARAPRPLPLSTLEIRRRNQAWAIGVAASILLIGVAALLAWIRLKV